MNEAEYLMKNYGDRGGCYPPRPYSARLGLTSSANILQIADVVLRVVFLLFLPYF